MQGLSDSISMLWIGLLSKWFNLVGMIRFVAASMIVLTVILFLIMQFCSATEGIIFIPIFILLIRL